MTWNTVAGTNKTDIINFLTKTSVIGKDHKIERKTLAHRLVNTILWTVDQININGVEGEAFISCHMLRYDLDGQGYSYNTSLESTGIGHINCPRSFLDMAPALNPNWRARVKFNSNEKKLKAA